MMWQLHTPLLKCRRNEKIKKETNVTLLPYAVLQLHTNSFKGPKNSLWTEDGSRVKLADGVILSGRHAELLIIPELASFLFIKKC